MTKYLTTLCLIGGGILPILVDVNTSHLLNPDWDSHARVHEAWRLSTNFLVFSLGIFLLWSKNKEMLGGIKPVYPFWFRFRSCLYAFLWRRASRRGYS